MPAPRFTPRRPIRPLNDDEWAILAPHFARPAGSPGRPLTGDPRARLDAYLHLACIDAPWREAPPGILPNSLARHFRRIAESGVWTRLLKILASRRCTKLLKSMEYWLLRGARRAMRVLGMKGLALARRLGLLTALPMLPWYCPNTGLSQTLLSAARGVMKTMRDGILPPPGLLTLLGRALVNAAGRRVWSRRLAPP